jgi:thiamine-phosphate pyrophosphorylase
MRVLPARSTAKSEAIDVIDFRFYLVTNRKLCAPRSLQSVVREACDSGVRAVQLREKDLPKKELEEYAARLLDITRERDTKLLVNRKETIEEAEDAFLAASLGTDGFHFPEGVTFPHQLRSRFPKLLVGVSTHSSGAALAAAAEGASFVTFGPVFETQTKTTYGEPQGLEELAKVASAVTVPVFAIGGVTPENAADCVAAGAHGVAVIGAIMTADDVTDAVKRFESSLGSL